MYKELCYKYNKPITMQGFVIVSKVFKCRSR